MTDQAARSSPDRSRPNPADLDAHLDQVHIGGQERRRIETVAYRRAGLIASPSSGSASWMDLGPVADCVEQVGSTAVPGLAAQPIVDIMVTVDDPDDEAAFLPALEAAGSPIARHGDPCGVLGRSCGFRCDNAQKGQVGVGRHVGIGWRRWWGAAR